MTHKRDNFVFSCQCSTRHWLLGITCRSSWRGLRASCDTSVYETICAHEDVHYLLDDYTHEGYTLFRFEGSLTFGIGLYDARKMAIDAYCRSH